MGQSASLGGPSPRTGKMGTRVGETIQTAPPPPSTAAEHNGGWGALWGGWGALRWRKPRAGLQRKTLCSQGFEDKASLSIKTPP